ncbi:hypothetical protein F5Y17DRAFT_32308 [Xylariaceae sp. FL0594]|nr:hypothetical protein F5Y17DRAFT_32308 [Xylariaceae sp. FL0594]
MPYLPSALFPNPALPHLPPQILYSQISVPCTLASRTRSCARCNNCTKLLRLRHLPSYLPILLTYLLGYSCSLVVFIVKLAKAAPFFLSAYPNSKLGASHLTCDNLSLFSLAQFAVDDARRISLRKHKLSLTFPSSRNLGNGADIAVQVFPTPFLSRLVESSPSPSIKPSFWPISSVPTPARLESVIPFSSI